MAPNRTTLTMAPARRAAAPGRRAWRARLRGLHLFLGMVVVLPLVASTVTGLLLLNPAWTGPAELEVTCMARHPDDPRSIYRGTTWGLEVSRNQGESWVEVPMLMPPGAIVAIEFSGNETWVLGQEGLVLSVDGGRIWETRQPTGDKSVAWADFIDLDAGAQGRLTVATRSGVWQTGDAGLTWQADPWPAHSGKKSLNGWIHDLHTGYLWQESGRQLYSFGALAILVVALSGAVLGLVKRRRRSAGNLGVIILLLVLPLEVRAAEAEVPVHEEARILMGTLARVMAWAPCLDQATAAASGALDEISRLENVFSTWQPQSEVSRLNSLAGKKPVKVSPELAEVLGLALKMSAASGGAFDPTVLPLVELWGFRNTAAVQIPAPSQLRETLLLVGHDQVDWQPHRQQAFLPRQGMALDFGGIAKGWALDRAAELMRQAGATSGRIDLGGGIISFGPMAAEVVGIVDPEGGSEPLGAIQLQDAALATSGQYERRRESAGKTWGHIIDPRSGQPVEYLLSVTIVAGSAALADAAATACFVLGLNEGLSLVESLPDCEGVFVAPAMDGAPVIHFSSGF